MTQLPPPAGPLSEAVIEYLRDPARVELPAAVPSDPLEALRDRDLQLALYVAYELHYRGFDDAAGEPWEPEWDPAVLAVRREMENAFLAGLHALVPPSPPTAPDEVGAQLFELARADDGPSVGRHLSETGTLEQFREFAMHRSAYQLKEADPHSWAIPRLDGAAKAALLEVQFDEYGSGRAERIHARLFADAMDALGLDSTYGAYLAVLPAETLATVNLMSLFGLHRRHRSAITGHLAMFEITSPGPNRLYARALRRLGAEDATEFFDEHVEADSIHENIAAYDLAQSLAVAEPDLTADILFGARALLALDALWAERVLASWDAGDSSLERASAAAV